jgi:hypothetical protein
MMMTIFDIIMHVLFVSPKKFAQQVEKGNADYDDCFNDVVFNDDVFNDDVVNDDVVNDDEERRKEGKRRKERKTSFEES